MTAKKEFSTRFAEKQLPATEETLIWSLNALHKKHTSFRGLAKDIPFVWTIIRSSPYGTCGNFRDGGEKK